MKVQSTFDHLVQTLSNEERKRMLEKIHGLERIDLEPLIVYEEEGNWDAITEYERFPFWKKLFFFFKSLLTSTDKYELVEEKAIRTLARSIQESSESLIYYENGELGPFFDEKIGEIKEAIQFFVIPIGKIFGGQKSDFIAFLVGWKMPLLQEELLTLLDPANIAFENSLDEPQEVRIAVEGKLSDRLSEIDEEDRKTFYRESRSLILLKKLIDFPLDTLTGQRDFSQVKNQLYEFSKVIHSLDPLPEEETLKVLFVFNLDQELEEKNFNPEERITAAMEEVNRLFRLLRRFVSQVRLNDLCKIVGRNLNYRAGQISGGEDWFRQYREFWEKRVAKALDQYIERVKRDRAVIDAATFLGKKDLPMLDYYRFGILPMDVQPAFYVSVSFINTFVKERFLQELHSPLKLVLIDGQFYKERNREEYNESYSAILKSIDEIRHIDISLSGDSRLRNDIEVASKEMMGSKIIRKRIQSIIGELERDAERIVTTFIDQMQIMIHVINGIVDGDMGGRYDTLSNLGYIGKNDNRNLLRRLRDVRTILDKALHITKGLYEIERHIDG
jgi:hypothetical protein